MSVITQSFSRHRVLYILGAVILVGLAAIPLTAYVIVPQFVRSTVQEAAPGSSSAPQATASSGVSAAPTTSSAPANTTLLTGQLQRINAVDFGTGKVSVIQAGGQRFLRFENVEIAAAPAQRVYLSDQTDGQPGTFTDLGALKATNGSFNYGIPAAVDLGKVKSVVSWCSQFKTTVTYAPLQPG
ncbi:MAG: DM13 domain-containing protein [Candidatus Dormibacteraeota bacterium]|nr:DM13 domain-containing protein [Candidatus Dormibacteraeota bacterium]